jgi:hypothetical protein
MNICSYQYKYAVYTVKWFYGFNPKPIPYLPFHFLGMKWNNVAKDPNSRIYRKKGEHP